MSQSEYTISHDPSALLTNFSKYLCSPRLVSLKKPGNCCTMGCNKWSTQVQGSYARHDGPKGGGKMPLCTLGNEWKIDTIGLSTYSLSASSLVSAPKVTPSFGRLSNFSWKIFVRSLVKALYVSLSQSICSLSVLYRPALRNTTDPTLSACRLIKSLLLCNSFIATFWPMRVCTVP